MNLADSDDLYHEVIMERGRRPHHAGRPAHYDRSAAGDNPMCGDRVQVFVALGPQGRIAEPHFDARGCAVSIASADLMAEAVTGLTADEVVAVFSRFENMVRTGDCPEGDAAMRLLRPLAGVHTHPSRLTCATLPWQVLLAALDGEGHANHE
jgi:nitrogen fixation protein NifU and related proteins